MRFSVVLILALLLAFSMRLNALCASYTHHLSIRRLIEILVCILTLLTILTRQSGKSLCRMPVAQIRHLHNSLKLKACIVSMVFK